MTQTHKVFILDDMKWMADSIAESVRSVDRDAMIVPARNVPEAIRQLDGHRSEFLYGIVDLHLSDNPQDPQGETFLEWLNDAGWLQQVRVLVFSSYKEERLDKLPRSITNFVIRKHRTARFRENDATIRGFVETVLGRPMGAGTPR